MTSIRETKKNLKKTTDNDISSEKLDLFALAAEKIASKHHRAAKNIQTLVKKAQDNFSKNKKSTTKVPAPWGSISV